jgi:hypothetical protein
VLAQLCSILGDEAQTSQTRINTLLIKEPLLEDASERNARLEIAIEECRSTIEQQTNDQETLRSTMNTLERVSPRSAVTL